MFDRHISLGTEYRGIKRKRHMGAAQQSSDLHRRSYTNTLKATERDLVDLAQEAHKKTEPADEFDLDTKVELFSKVVDTDLYRRALGQPVLSSKEGQSIGLYLGTRSPDGLHESFPGKYPSVLMD